MGIVYTVAVEKFSGPLDTLLSLVEERKLSINEVSLADVADQYIAYLRALEELPKEELAVFLVIAATLMLIKSRSLLPGIALTEEDKTDIRELERRLKTYQFFKLLSRHLKEDMRAGKHLFDREAYAGLLSVFTPPEGATPLLLMHTLRELLTSIPQKDRLPTDVLEKTVSLEEKMADLRGRVDRVLKLTFDEFKKGASKKVEVIVSFLAMLELIKQGLLAFEQTGLFGTINISKHERTRKKNRSALVRIRRGDGTFKARRLAQKKSSGDRSGAFGA